MKKDGLHANVFKLDFFSTFCSWSKLVTVSTDKIKLYGNLEMNSINLYLIVFCTFCDWIFMHFDFVWSLWQFGTLYHKDILIHHDGKCSFYTVCFDAYWNFSHNVDIKMEFILLFSDLAKVSWFVIYTWLYTMLIWYSYSWTIPEYQILWNFITSK